MQSRQAFYWRGPWAIMNDHIDKEEIEKITSYIFLESKPQKADLALIFGTRFPKAAESACMLYKNGAVPAVLVSGGINRMTEENEAHRIKGELAGLGVNSEDIFLEDESTNSLENALFSRDRIDALWGLGNIRRIAAVVKHYHSRRALMTLRKHFPEHIELVPFTYEVYGFTKHNWHESEKGREKVLGEWKKIHAYLDKGDIAEIDG